MISIASRGVKRAFPCGADPTTGHDYGHREEWTRERFEQSASIFAIDICGYAVMSNHLHVTVRSRPDLVRDWSIQLDKMFARAETRKGQSFA